jgi:predicted ATPase
LGVEPAQQTQALYKRIRSAGKASPHNLPPQLTSLIGREGDLQQLARRLANPNCRLLTLTGPGGIGKTRLALQAATEHVGFFLDGVYFVPLAALSSATFLVSTIADALDLRFSGSQDPETELLDYLREKEMLLVLDNFEHLLSLPEKGIEGEAKLLLDILKHAPEVKIMVTSRIRLNFQAEWVFKVRELAFPEKVDAEGVETYSAVRLFFERARRVETGFLLSAATIPAVVRICQLVEGMPLGIELAAAFVLALSCQQIAAEIERNLDVLATSMQDVPERHRSLRAVLEHSWNLLSAAEKAVIRKLAVFQGTFEPEAARAVTGATLPQLGALADKSFLNRGQTGQYDIHPLLKQYAAEKLAVDPQEQAKTEARHGAYYADFMAAMLEKRKQAEQHQDIHAAVKAAIGNVVAALQWAAARRKPAALNNIIYLLYLYYDASGQYETGKKVFEQALGMMEKYANPSDEECLVLAKVLGFVSVYNLRLAAYYQARERLQQSLAIARQLEHEAHISFCLHALSEVALGLGDYAETKRLAEEALAVRRQTGGSTVTILNFLGKVALEEGKLTEARERQAEALAIARANKQVISGNIAHPLEGLGLVAHRMGKPLAAREYLQESLEICRAIDHKWGIADCLNGLGRIATDLGQYQLAEQLFQESLAGYVDIGKSDEAALLMRNQGWLAECLADYEKAKRLYRKSYNESKKTQEKSKRLSALADLGRVTILLGEHQAAEQHLQQALTFFDTMGHQGGLAIALTGLGILERECRHYQEAQRHFRKALQAAMREQEIYEALKTLVELATLLAEQDKNETVLEILAFIFQHPATTQYHRNRAEAPAAKLPTEGVATAREQGKNRPFTEIVAMVLNE